VPPDPRSILPRVIEAALDAGHMIAREFARPDGPRFSDHVTAPLDTEIELMLRDRLLPLVQARFVGEEAGVVEAPANGFCWVVDPHDGTRAFLEGKRGSAVSVALLHRGTPVLAVVHAPTSPDRGSDLITWAEGEPIRRDGAPVTINLRDRTLAEGDVVFLNHGAWQRPVWQGTACAPAGFLPLPSIAYRLARIAVGDGIATQTLRPVNALDIAAGHALLMAAGGVLVAEDGTPVTYSEDGESRPSACFGGAPAAVEVLRVRAWRGSQEPRRTPRVTLTWPRLAPERLLDRAVGCLFGLAIGGALGPDVELAMVVARSIVGQASYDKERVERAVAVWAEADGDQRGASPLVRAIPIGIWARDPAAAAAAAREDRPDDPTHAALAATVATCVEGGTPDDARQMLAGVIALDPTRPDPRVQDLIQPGGLDPDRVRSGARAPDASAPETHRASVIAGALAGALTGRVAFPIAAIMRVLSWRPDPGLGVARPRPEFCWTDDLPELAEALLCQGQRNLTNETRHAPPRL
jgi:fructose-1,6-bisphosphatase/inositol monophosphatase family enzyme